MYDVNNEHDCFPGFINERNTENAMSHLYFKCDFAFSVKKVIILRKIHVTMNSFAPSFPTWKETKHIYPTAANLLHKVLE